ncbi:MAG: hypothetical protein QOK49_3229, partial [Baekduia sp.]|nr:hypothetical protein [Baekduia sp.]
MSLRSSLWRYLGLLAVAALTAGVFAGPASAKKLSAKQRAAVRAQLKKEIKKNPKAINRTSFIKRASLVNFVLPVTVALRSGDKPGTPTNEGATANPNSAKIDLGASLGQREVDLGGSLAAEIRFHDSYDGGALGNVDLEILKNPNHTLTSTSIPLLWNTQVTQPGSRYDANALGLPSGVSGCGSGSGPAGFTGSAALPFGADQPAIPLVTPAITVFGAGLPGYPFFSTPGAAATWGTTHGAGLIAGFLPEKPGIDGTERLATMKNPGDDMVVGGATDPFPTALPGSDPGADGTFVNPTAADTVLRTNALKLGVADPATEVNAFNGSGVEGSQNLKMGKSGGQANLFGKIPGKPYGIDVSVNLETKINSILRIVDQDSTGYPLVTGDDYPAGVFNCRQVWTGAVQNYIPSVHLQGSLKIAPAVTAKGHLRIAKATLTQLDAQPSRFGVAACLAPYSAFAADGINSSSDDMGPTGGGEIPAGDPLAPVSVSDNGLPAVVFNQRPAPSGVAC